MNKIDELTKEEAMKFELFVEKGIVGNPALKETVDNDRVVAISKDGNKKVFKDINMAARHFSEGDEKKVANIKFRIRNVLINQIDRTVMKHEWDVLEEDYLKRI